MRYFKISTSNHMLGRVIWDKFPKGIFENLPRKSPEPNMSLLVNHTKQKHFQSKLISFNNGQLQISNRQSQNSG